MVILKIYRSTCLQTTIRSDFNTDVTERHRQMLSPALRQQRILSVNAIALRIFTFLNAIRYFFPDRIHEPDFGFESRRKASV